MITVTDQAIQKIMEFQGASPDGAGKAFRIRVDTGGCSGFTYDYSFDERQADDLVVECGTVLIVVDAQSLPIVQGSTIDYVEDFSGSGFTVTNPNSTASCGCGKSFGV